MKSEKIWNKIVAFFKTAFFSLLKWIFGACLFLLRLSLWECFLGGCRFENTFWRFSLWMIFWRWSLRKWFLLLLLWKLFLAPVAYLFENDFLFLSFLALVALKTFWHFFENVFLAIIALKFFFWNFWFFEIFGACSCEDVSCARGF